MKIVVFSVVPWDFLWQRMQHIASGLALKGHEIVYFEEPVYISSGSFLRDRAKRKQPIEIKSVKDNLWTVKFFVPELRGKLESIKDRYLNSYFKAALRKLDFQPDVAIFYTLEFVPLIQTLNSLNTKITFDCADDILSFVRSAIKQGIMPKNSLRKFTENEVKLIKSASACFASSKILCDKISKHNSKCVYLPNAMDFDHFDLKTKLPKKIEDLPNLKHPVVGFIGAVFEWFDAKLISQLAQLHPEYSILLVGPVNSGKAQLDSYPNIIMVGAKPYESLPSYLSNIDVCLIPFKINDITLASNPIKMYEYLAAGKPVVSTALPEVVRNASEIVYIGKDEMDFLRKVEIAVNENKDNDNDAIEIRKSFARRNSWENRVQVIEKVLGEVVNG
jgi:O-antigen biosynthesis protein